MELSEGLLKKRIAALLPNRSRASFNSKYPSSDNPGQLPIDLSEIHAILDDEQFLQEAYRKILGRECDVSGFVHFVELLRRHVPRRVILLQLINSAEGRNQLGRFTGLEDPARPTTRRTKFVRLRNLVGRLDAFARDLIRRVLFIRFDSIDHRLDYILLELTGRTDSLASKTDQALWTLSQKLDAYVTSILEAQRRNDEEVTRMNGAIEKFQDTGKLQESRLANLESRTTALNASLDKVTASQAVVESITRRLDHALLETIARTDELVSQTERSLSAVSRTFDVSLARVMERQDRSHEELSRLNTEFKTIREADGALERCIARLENGTTGLRNSLREITATLETIAAAERTGLPILEDVRVTTVNVLKESQKALDSLNKVSARIRPPVIASSSGVIATEIDDLIIGVPGNEWRMAAHHSFRGLMEPGLAEYLRRTIRSGAVVVDVGANVGECTLLAAKLLQGQGKVYSFEPTPRTYRILRDNIQINGFLETGIVELFQLAVTDKTGSAQLSVYDADCGHNTLFEDERANGVIEVSTTTLDEVLAGQQQVDVVKIDVEGAEPLVMRGMQQVIRRNPAIRVIVEFAPVHLKRAGIRPLDFFQEIESIGFIAQRIDGRSGSLLPVTAEELQECFSVNLELERRAPR